MAYKNYIKKNRIFIFVITFVFIVGCAALKPYRSVGLSPKIVRLTFDDGPNAHNSVTESVLDVLKRHDGRDCEDRMLSEIDKDSTSSYNRSWIPEAVDSIVTKLKRSITDDQANGTFFHKK